jgi:hypothetical protein
MTFHDLPRCGVHDPDTGHVCDRPAETCGYCVPCWVAMDLEGIPDDDPTEPRYGSGFEDDARAAKECG